MLINTVKKMISTGALSVIELSQKLGLSEGSINQWLNGHTSGSNSYVAKKIQTYLNSMQSSSGSSTTSASVPSLDDITMLIDRKIAEALANVTTKVEVATIVDEKVTAINCTAPIKNDKGSLEVSFDNSLSIKKNNLSVNNLPVFCFNEGNMTEGQSNLFSYTNYLITSKTGGSFQVAKGRNTSGNPVILDQARTIKSNEYENGTYNIFALEDGTLEAYSQAVLGKDLYVDFSQGNPNDNYGLHQVTIAGSPTFAENRYISNGDSHVRYLIPSMGDDTWCMQGKFKFNALNVEYGLFSGDVPYNFTLWKQASNSLILYASTNRTSWNIASAITGVKTDWDINTEYYIRARFTGTQYLIDWSLDKKTWINDIAVTSSEIVASMNCIRFGKDYEAEPLNGTMGELQVTIGNPTCILRNQLIVQPNTPLNPTNNMMWLNTRTEPISANRYSGSSWYEFFGIPAGTFTVKDGTFTNVTSNPFNQNGYIANKATGLKMKCWSSQEYPLTLGVGVNIIHNLNLTTDYFVVPFLTCKVAVEGYSVGETIQGPFELYSSSNSEDAALAVSANSVYQPVGHQYTFFTSNKAGTSYMVAANVPAYFTYKVKIFYMA